MTNLVLSIAQIITGESFMVGSAGAWMIRHVNIFSSKRTRLKPARPDEIVVLRTSVRQPSKTVYIPESALPNREGQGYVIAIGSKVRELKKGDYILFNRQGTGSGFSFVPKRNLVSEDDNEYVLCLKESDVIGVIE